MSDIVKEIIHPIFEVLDGKEPTETMAGMAAVVACIMHQSMMPGIAERVPFDAAMGIFARQVQENLVMLIEEHKG